MSDSLKPMLALLAMLPAASRAAMAQMYRVALREELAVIGDALERDPLDALGALRALHKICGSAGLMRDQALSLAARATEDALRAGSIDFARQTHWPAMQACAELTVQALTANYPPAP